MNIKYKHRFLAKMVLEAETPLSVGSGNKDIFTDSLVMRDVNGLPYIPGTSIAGVVRHFLIDNGVDIRFFGFQETHQDNNGEGSQIIFSDAKLVGLDGKAVDGLQDMEVLNRKEFYKSYQALPIRQHAKIGPNGATKKGGKFDEQVVFAGSRFCFELELVAENKAIDKFSNVLNQFRNSIFRLGGGTRKGFGKVSVVSMQTAYLDLQNSEQLNSYISKPSDLSSDWDGWNKYSFEYEEDPMDSWKRYKLEIQPEDFFLFGSGLGNDKADITRVKGRKVKWDADGKNPTMEDDMVLIPATSVKGALAHRVAYYYNKEKKYFFGDPEAKTGNDNEAVRQLFGYVKEGSDDLKKGNVIFNDVIETKKKGTEDHLVHHVTIDRFTGGAFPGALFQEETLYGNKQSFTLELLVNDKVDDKAVLKAFNSALRDVTTGMLPLGGGVNRGNGVFSGTIVEPKLTDEDYVK